MVFTHGSFALNHWAGLGDVTGMSPQADDETDTAPLLPSRRPSSRSFSSKLDSHADVANRSGSETQIPHLEANAILDQGGFGMCSYCALALAVSETLLAKCGFYWPAHTILERIFDEGDPDAAWPDRYGVVRPARTTWFVLLPGSRLFGCRRRGQRSGSQTNSAMVWALRLRCLPMGSQPNACRLFFPPTVPSNLRT